MHLIPPAIVTEQVPLFLHRFLPHAIQLNNQKIIYRNKNLNFLLVIFTRFSHNVPLKPNRHRHSKLLVESNFCRHVPPFSQ